MSLPFEMFLIGAGLGFSLATVVFVAWINRQTRGEE